MIIPVRLVLDLAPGSLHSKARDSHARAHIEWVRALEVYHSGPKTKAHQDPDMTPGDRGLSRYVEASLPRSVRQAIDRRLRAAQTQVDHLNGSARSATRRAFVELRDRLTAQALSVSGGRGELTANQQTQIASMLDREMSAFEGRLKSEWARLRLRAVRAGAKVADVPVELVGGQVGPVEPPPDLGTEDLFDTLRQRFAADQQRKLTGKLNQLRQGNIGQAAAIMDIRAIIAEPEHSAERIMRTEAGRAAKLTTDDRMRQNGKVLRGMQKQWVAAFVNTRPEHAAAHLQTVGVDDKFLVGGERCSYPMDPVLSASNSINCMCVSSPVVDEAEVDVDAILA